MTTSLLHPRSPLTHRHEAAIFVARVVDYLFGLVYAVLMIRLVLDMIGARRDAGFVRFIVYVTAPFFAPFRGIVASDTLDGTHPIVWPLVVAIVAYMLLHAAIRGLLRFAAHD